jgi:hypothetical protein
MRMSADLRDLFLYEAFLYYNPLLLVVSSFHCYVCFALTVENTTNHATIEYLCNYDSWLYCRP